MLTKCVHATLDYAVEWPRARLLGVPIEESAWTCRPEGLIIEPREAGPGVVAVRISGGERGVAYTLTNRVMLADDRTCTCTLDLETV